MNRKAKGPQEARLGGVTECGPADGRASHPTTNASPGGRGVVAIV